MDTWVTLVPHITGVTFLIVGAWTNIKTESLKLYSYTQKTKLKHVEATNKVLHTVDCHVLLNLSMDDKRPKKGSG